MKQFHSKEGNNETGMYPYDIKKTSKYHSMYNDVIIEAKINK